MEIETTVGDGFPVIAKVTHVSPPEPDVGIFGPQIEWMLTMRDGTKCPPFVDRMVTANDSDRINDELHRAWNDA